MAYLFACFGIFRMGSFTKHMIICVQLSSSIFASLPICCNLHKSVTLPSAKANYVNGRLCLKHFLVVQIERTS